MPWKETSAMNERVRFVGDWLSGRYTKSALCRAYGISRPTGDKWIRRYEALGLAGLEERSRAPHTHPNAVPESIRERIVATKLRYQAWGPKKVMDYLRRRYPEEPWPADSTAGELLKRAGLVRPRTPRRHVPPYSALFGACAQPNDLWSIDFKGDFRLGDGQRRYPLTVSDNFSRFLLHCRALPRTGTAWAQPWLEWVFREYGRHERLHRTLNPAVQPPAANLARQQARFDAFRDEYNRERAHEALGRQTPGSLYCASPRPYPARLPRVEYDEGVTVRQVRQNGEIKWRGRLVYVSEVLAQEPIALLPLDDGRWELRYSFHLLGFLDERTGKLTPARRWHGT